jgi:hypothetical protein
MRLPQLFTSMLLGLCFFMSPAEAAASASCNNATLEGSYIFFANGRTGVSSSSDQVAYAAMIVYDGQGNAKFAAVYADGAEVTLLGEYSIDSDCKGRVTYENGRTAVYFVSPSGDDLVYVVTQGAVIASSVKRVSRDQLLTLGAPDRPTGR